MGCQHEARRTSDHGLLAYSCNRDPAPSTTAAEPAPCQRPKPAGQTGAQRTGISARVGTTPQQTPPQAFKAPPNQQPKRPTLKRPAPKRPAAPAPAPEPAEPENSDEGAALYQAREQEEHESKRRRGDDHSETSG